MYWHTKNQVSEGQGFEVRAIERHGLDRTPTTRTIKLDTFTVAVAEE